jgi:hypothetical protein
MFQNQVTNNTEIQPIEDGPGEKVTEPVSEASHEEPENEQAKAISAQKLAATAPTPSIPLDRRRQKGSKLAARMRANMGFSRANPSRPDRKATNCGRPTMICISGSSSTTNRWDI